MLRAGGGYYRFGYSLHAPNYDEINGTPSQPAPESLNLGDDFYAGIYYVPGNAFIETTGGDGSTYTDVKLGSRTTSYSSSDPRQIWHFIRHSDGSYKIINEYSGWCLDVAGGKAFNECNVATWYEDHNGNPQRWSVHPDHEERWYNLTSSVEYPNYCLDIFRGYGDPGTNVQIFRREGYPSQQFDIRKQSSYRKPAKPSTPTFRSLSGTPERTVISWNAVAPVNAYDSREYILEIYDVTNSRYVLRNQRVTGTSYTTTLPAGNYRAEVQAVNTKYPDYKSGWNMGGYFTVYPFRTVTLTASPAEGGIVNGGGKYTQGDYTTLQAKPNEGWHFAGWVRNGQAVTDWVDDGGSVANYGLTVTGDETFQALFEQESLPIPTYTVRVSTEGGGTVTGGGSYEAGQSVTAVATPVDGYAFKEWTENGVQVSTSRSYTFEAREDRQLTAVFEKITPVMYTISVAAAPAPGGAVTGSGRYEAGSSVTVIATPADGYTFLRWTAGGTQVSASASYTFTVNEDRQLTAVFEEKETPPAPPAKYTISVQTNLTAGGTVSGGGSFDVDSSVTVTAAANPGYHFVEWRENGVRVSTDTGYTFPVKANRSLIAVFEKDAPAVYTVSVSASPSSGGTVRGSGSYEAGKSVTVTAAPAAGYQFLKWKETGAAENPYRFTVDKSQTLTAIFEKIDTPPTTYMVSLSATPGGTVTGSGSYAEGTSVTVTATPSQGYHFVEWLEDGAAVVEDASYRFSIRGDRALRAVFAPDAPAQTIQYVVEVSAVPPEGGTVTGGGNYEADEEVTVTAAPKEDYRFLRWVADGNEKSTDAQYTFRASESLNLSAVFEKQGEAPTPPVSDLYTVSVNASPAAGGTASGGGVYRSGASVTVAAAANSGYRFIGWTVNAGGITLSDSAAASFTMPARNVAVTAHFESISSGRPSTPSNSGNYLPPAATYPPIVNQSGEGGSVTVSPSHPAKGDTVTVCPEPEEGCKVDKIAVTGQNGDPVTVRDNGDGTFFFIQPAGKVTIEIDFAPIPPTKLPWSNPFSDISGNAWYYEAVRFVQERKLMNGYEDGRFWPDGLLSRAQFAQILFNIEGGSMANDLVDFSDVADEAWYAEAVRWATSQGIMEGYGDGQFGPNRPITREQLAAILYRYAQLKGYDTSKRTDLSGYTDAASISAYALDALRWLVAEDLITGKTAVTLVPSGEATRAEVAMILMRFCENVAKGLVAETQSPPNGI